MKDRQRELALRAIKNQRYRTFFEIANKPDFWIEPLDHQQRKAIHFASEHGQLGKVKTILLAHPESLNSLDNLGQSPLIWACSRGHTEVATYLLSNGARTDYATTHAKDEVCNGWTALDWAERFNLKNANKFEQLISAKEKQINDLKKVISAVKIGYVIMSYQYRKLHEELSACETELIRLRETFNSTKVDELIGLLKSDKVDYQDESIKSSAFNSPRLG